MKPLKNYVLVKQESGQQDTTTESGIVLTGGISQGPKPGIVKEVGPDVDKNISVGDKVVLAWEKGLKVSSDEVLVGDEFILAIY